MNSDLHRLQQDRDYAEKSYYQSLRHYQPSQVEVRNSRCRLSKLNSQIEKILVEAKK